MDDVGDSSSMDLDGGVDFDDLGGLGNDEAATFDFTQGPTNGIRHDLAAKEPRHPRVRESMSLKPIPLQE